MPEHVLLGVIIAAHGIKGEVKVKSFAARPESFMAYGPLLTEDGRTLTVTALRAAGEGVILRFAEIADRNRAEALKGAALYVPRAALPAPEVEEFYLADLIGLGAEDTSGAALGTVLAVHDFGAGAVLEIGAGAETELVPFTRESVPLVDLAGGRIVVALDEDTA